MKLSIRDLKTPRQWRATVGCDAHHFTQLLVVFQQAYASLHQATLADRLIVSPLESHMQHEEDLLFFTLFSC